MPELSTTLKGKAVGQALEFAKACTHKDLTVGEFKEIVTFLTKYYNDELEQGSTDRPGWERP